MESRRIFFTLVLTCLAFCLVECKRKKEKPSTALVQSKEETVGGFMGLLAMRLLYGLASWAGLGDWASGLFNGALRPPNSDYDDYYGDYGGGGDDDYDY